MLIKRKSIEAQGSRREGPAPPRRRAPRFAPVTLSECAGVRYLHFGTEWVQGAMRIRSPYRLELHYAEHMMAWMLFVSAPRRLAQLGLGAGSLSKFCLRSFPEAHVEVAEINPEVIAVCAHHFAVPENDARFQVLCMDALDFVNDPERHGQYDALQVDLYDATARGPVLEDTAFYAACAACLAPHGVMSVNLFGEHPSYTRNLNAMRRAFRTVLCLPPVAEGNVVALAFNQLPTLNAATLRTRAAAIRKATGLPASEWVSGLLDPAAKTLPSAPLPESAHE